MFEKIINFVKILLKMRHKQHSESKNNNFEIKQQLIRTLETHSNNKNYWKSVSDISKLCKINIDKTNELILSDEFARNKIGKFTTRTLYRKYTPFYKKVLDSYVGKIQ